jgi:hypothetical protein
MASMASAMGVARMPTQGSWRPWVTTSVGVAVQVHRAPGQRMLEVGFSARRATMRWPVEMPPSTPPALLLRKPSG